VNEPVVWEPTLAAVDAERARARAASLGIRAAQGDQLATIIRSLGSSYTPRYTTEVQTQRNRDETEHEARERAAYELVRAPFESLDAEARALDPLTDAPIHYSYPERLTETASATLGGLRVTALDAGSFGNAITVSANASKMDQAIKNLSPPPLSNVIALVQTSTLTDPEKEEHIATLLAARQVHYTAAESTFALRVARGNQIETFDNMTVGSLPSKPSELVALEWIGDVRPVSQSLTGGSGAVFATLRARIDRLAPDNPREASIMRARLRNITPNVPPIRYSVPFGGPPQGLWYPGPPATGELPSIQSIESELVMAISEAETWLAT
jgi:hypothetical protein